MCEKQMLHGNQEKPKEYPVLDGYLHDTGKTAITSANTRPMDDGTIYLSIGMQAGGHESLSMAAFLTKGEAAALRDKLSEALDLMETQKDVPEMVEGVNGKTIPKSEDGFTNPDSKNFDPDAAAHDPDNEW